MIALAAMLKEEDRFVREWLAYHRMIGFDHFFLCDNDPALPLRKIFGHLDYVTVINWPDSKGQPLQIKAYRHLCQEFRQCEWMAFVDGDEFIVLKEHDDVKAFLKNYEPYSQIMLNWRVFGNNGHIQDPEFILEKLTRRADHDAVTEKWFNQTKAIVRPAKVIDIPSPHQFRVSGETQWVSSEKAHVNHYFARSYQTFMGRVDRGDSMGKMADIRLKKLKEVWSMRNLPSNAVEDTEMLKYVPRVKDAVKSCRRNVPSRSVGQVSFSDVPLDFDWKYYLAKHPDLSRAGIVTEAAAKRHWVIYGKKECRSYKVGWVIQKTPADFDWEYYLAKYPDLLEKGVKDEKAAIRHWRNSGWKEGRLWRRLPRKASLNPLSDLLASLWYAWQRNSKRQRKIVVYTAIFGGTDTLKAPSALALEADVDYVCFTNKDIPFSPAWQIRKVGLIDDNPILTSRYYKMNPHKLFPHHEQSIWVDATYHPIGSISRFLTENLANDDMACFQHPERNCIYQEADKCIQSELDDVAIIQKQIEKYQAERYPAGNGLFAGAILLRKHHESVVIKAMEDWWREFQENSWRDQVSLTPVLYRNRVKCAVIPGNYRINPYFKWVNHRDVNRPSYFRSKTLGNTLMKKEAKKKFRFPSGTFKIGNLGAFFLKRFFSAKRPSVGWVLFGDENNASSRIQGINIHSYLKGEGWHSVILYKPLVYSPRLLLSRFFRWIILHSGLDILIFQKVYWGGAPSLSKKCRAKGIKTVLLLADLPRSKDELRMSETYDHLVVVSERLAEELIICGIDPLRVSVIDDAIETPPSLCKHYDVNVEKTDIRIICVGNPDSLTNLTLVEKALRTPALKNYRLTAITKNDKAVKWDLKAVWKEILASDIAVVPFNMDSSQHLGKSTNRFTLFKSLGIPMVCSPIPSYEKLIDHRRNAYLARTVDEWVEALLALRDVKVRQQVGLCDRDKILGEYGISAIGGKYKELFRSICVR